MRLFRISEKTRSNYLSATILISIVSVLIAFGCDKAKDAVADKVAEKVVPVFKAGKEMRMRLNKPDGVAR